MFRLIFQDPVVWGSLLGLFVVLAICGYYAWMFITKPGEDS